jgi:HNH endonuclease
VARSPGGPRAGGLDEAKIDSHENLILLCSDHHKQVDDQSSYFTREVDITWRPTSGRGGRPWCFVQPHHDDLTSLRPQIKYHPLWSVLAALLRDIRRKRPGVYRC